MHDALAVQDGAVLRSCMSHVGYTLHFSHLRSRVARKGKTLRTSVRPVVQGFRGSPQGNSQALGFETLRLGCPPQHVPSMARVVRIGPLLENGRQVGIVAQRGGVAGASGPRTRPAEG